VIPIIGYADRLSVRPGERIGFKVSSTLEGSYRARLVRVRSGDPNPAIGGVRVDDHGHAFSGSFPARRQEVALGSYVRIPGADALLGHEALTLAATVWPSTPAKGEQGILSLTETDGACLFALQIDAHGRASALVRLATGETLEAAVPRPLKVRSWYRLVACYDAARGELSISESPLGDGFSHGPQAAAAARPPEPIAPAASVTAFVGALGGMPVAGHFNGKIEAPTVARSATDAAVLASSAQQALSPDVLARWDFSLAIASLDIVDTGPLKLHGRAVNLPTRAVTGSGWNGSEHCWRHAPSHFAAIHFHDDDLLDCGWQTDFELEVPADLASGLYAMRLEADGHVDDIPFVVAPPRGARRADLCLVIPTFTYVVYANHARPDFSAAWTARAEAWQAYPHNPAVHRDYGLSTYNMHSDGSGIAYSSWLRPMINWRPGYLTFPSEVGSGLRHLQADTHLLIWLDTMGYAYDVVSDHDVHEEGADLLSRYRTVLTASHPEYHTRETLDAFLSYRNGGGRLVYLGGNGFYWRVALSKDVPGAIEIRRAEGGLRAWAAEPGEYYNAFDGELGGLWRRAGRPPQALVGVGFSAQGGFYGSYYRVRAEAKDARVSWMLDGIADERLGDFGYSGGGAAGFELDRADERLGTPAHAVVVATSQDHTHPTWMLVPEEQLTHITTLPGAPKEELIRADMTFFEAPNDGAVFSVGSITFCGSLPWNGCDNNISRLLKNVVDRFLDPDARFPLPSSDA